MTLGMDRRRSRADEASLVYILFLSHETWTTWLLIADDILTGILFRENWYILIEISLKFMPRGLIDNRSALVEVMACRRAGDKPLPKSVSKTVANILKFHQDTMCWIWIPQGCKSAVTGSMPRDRYVLSMIMKRLFDGVNSKIMLTFPRRGFATNV